MGKGERGRGGEDGGEEGEGRGKLHFASVSMDIGLVS